MSPREIVCVGVPDSEEAPLSPVSVTVMLYVPVEAAGSTADLVPLADAPTCVVTFNVFTTGGVFCGR